MKERPILFSGPMVRALLDGSKTQTRRIANKLVKHPDGYMCTPNVFVHEKEPQHVIDRACPYGQPGNRLWVRETWFDNLCLRTPEDNREDVIYRADGIPDWEGEEALIRWKPSIHMPRWASRITLEITGVRVERLQDINILDAKAEGVEESAKQLRGLHARLEHCYAYEDLWESINGPGSWDANPFVWVVDFKRAEGGAA